VVARGANLIRLRSTRVGGDLLGRPRVPRLGHGTRQMLSRSATRASTAGSDLGRAMCPGDGPPRSASPTKHPHAQNRYDRVSRRGTRSATPTAPSRL
jgi:hypothetical protein